MQRVAKIIKLFGLHNERKSCFNRNAILLFLLIGIGCLYVIFFGFLNFLIIKIVLIFIYCFNRYYNLLHFIYSILFILCNKYKAVRWASNKQKYTSFDLGRLKP